MIRAPTLHGAAREIRTKCRSYLGDMILFGISGTAGVGKLVARGKRIATILNAILRDKNPWQTA
jgi:hypothetical protein